MELLDTILHGFSVATEPQNLMFLFFGAVMGTIIGLLPGIGASTGIAILLPVTYGMTPVTALIMLAGIYYGAMYGNTASAVLINTPGTSSAAMTTVDGYPMARNGRAGSALAISAIASFIAGTIGIVFLSLLAIPLSAFALKFGPDEYFALMFFAMTSVSALTGKSVAKGMIAAALGLMLATVGIDMQSGEERFTLGIADFQDGISFLIVIVGLFAISEIMINVERWFQGELKPMPIQGKLWLTREEWRRSIKPIAYGGLIGFFVGVLPGAGGTMATVLAYSLVQKTSPNADQFGKGAIEGVAAPEAANNASTCGAFVPLLTLGIPGSGTTAVLLGAFILYGVVPGPQLFAEKPDLVWGLIDSMYLGNVILLILNLPLIGLFVRLLYVPPGILLAIILAVATVGIYSVDTNIIDLYKLLFFGGIGYVFRKLEIPIPPLILTLVLGAMMENAFRQALTISFGNPIIFLTSPISATLMATSVIAILIPILGPRFRKMRETAEGE